MFVSDILEDVIEALGRCDKERAFARISKAIQALQDEGDWNANIGAVDVRACYDGRTITLPPQVETPLAVAINNRPVFMRDEFYKFHLNGDGLTDHCVDWVWDDAGVVPVFMDIKSPSPIIAIASLISDSGKKIRILGFDDRKRHLRTQQEDGVWIDGIEVPLNILSDFPGGVMVPPPMRQVRRFFQVTPITTFSSITDHELVTGAYIQVGLVSGTMPQPIINGGYYYLRVVNDKVISLHKNRLDSRTGQDPIQITEIVPGSVIFLQDSRKISSRNQFQSAGDSLLADFDLVTFTGAPVPEPLSTDTPYYVKPTSNDKFSIYATKEDAQGGINVLNVSTPGMNVKVRRLKKVSPFTTLTFSVKHNFLTGDAVTADNVGGVLPAPLLAGTNYYVHAIDNYTVSIHTNITDAQTGLNPVNLTNAGAGTNTLTKIIPASVVLGSSNNISAPGHNLNTPAGAGATGTAHRTGTVVTSITIDAPGAGYEVPPTVTITGGAGTGATATAAIANGIVTAINIVTGGTGYSSDPTVTITPAAGSFVRFATNGTLPDPIQQGTVYRAEAPMSVNTFTLNSTVPEAINITSAGTGQLFLLISRTFSVGFLPQWQIDATNYQTGQEIRFFTQGLLPITSPIIDQTTIYFLRKLSNSTVEIYDTLAHAQNLASTTGRYSTLSLGVGDLFLSSELDVAAIVRDNFLDIEFSGYLQDFVDVKFETNGTLPQPLNTVDTYQAAFSQGRLQVYDGVNQVVELTGIGSGVHSLIVYREFNIDPATSLDIPGNQFLTGEKIRASINDDGELPNPLNENTNYYARMINADQLELYGTSAQALNLASTTGRIVYLNVGSGDNFITQELPTILVSEVTQIEAPMTDGFKTIYAFDSGRKDNLTLLADINPQITNPVYRRIKIGQQCGVVRMKYRAKTIKITSERDFINLASELSIIWMIKSHELAFKNFVDEAERYRKMAVELLNKRDRAIDGPRSIPIQIDADTTTCPDDWMN